MTKATADYDDSDERDEETEPTFTCVECGDETPAEDMAEANNGVRLDVCRTCYEEPAVRAAFA